MSSSISSWLWGSTTTTKPTTTAPDAPKRSDSTSKLSVNDNGEANGVPQIVIGNGDVDGTPHASPTVETKLAAANGTGVPEAKTFASDGMFPSLTSPQRVADPTPTITLSSPKTSPVLDGSDRQMPPPPVPVSSGAGGLKAAVKAQKKAMKRQLREALAPGHSQMDWAILKTKGTNLRGVDQILRVTPSMLAQHNTKEDAWSVFFGKVYNITPYMAYHPGGERKLIRVAGKDGTKLFVHSHEWINVEAMMDECFVGFLVPEPPAEE